MDVAVLPAMSSSDLSPDGDVPVNPVDIRRLEVRSVHGIPSTRLSSSDLSPDGDVPVLLATRHCRLDERCAL